MGAGGLDVLSARRPSNVLPSVRRVGRALGNRKCPAPQPTRRLCLLDRGEGIAVLALDRAVLGLEEAGGDSRVVPHGDLAGLILREALVEARVRRVLLAGVVHELGVEVERRLELGLVNHGFVGLPTRRRRPPRPAEGVQHGGERGTEIAPTGFAAQANPRPRLRVDLAGDAGDLIPGRARGHRQARLREYVLAVHHERRLTVEGGGVELPLSGEAVAHRGNEVIVVVGLVGLGLRRQVLNQPGGAELRCLIHADHHGVESFAA